MTTPLQTFIESLNGGDRAELSLLISRGVSNTPKRQRNRSFTDLVRGFQDALRDGAVVLAPEHVKILKLVVFAQRGKLLSGVSCTSLGVLESQGRLNDVGGRWFISRPAVELLYQGGYLDEEIAAAAQAAGR